MDIALRGYLLARRVVRFQILSDFPHKPEKALMSKLKALIPAMFSLALVAAPAVTPVYAGGNLVAVLEAEIATLDPHFTPAYISRTFGFMVFDTLFAKDAKGEIKPQMVQD
jgi:peptide/nickel transport system substrate-binding protein